MASKELTELSKGMADGTITKQSDVPTNTIPVDVLNVKQPPLELGDMADAEMDERGSLMMESQNAINQIETDLGTTREKLSSEEEAAKRLIKDLGQRDAYTAKLEDAYGLSDLESKLSGLNSEISAENRLAPARLLQAQKDAEGTGLTMASLGTRLGNRERDNAIRSLVLAAEADIVQGRVNAADARITRAVDAKFKPMENELELRKFNLGRIDKVLENSETKLSAAQQRKYDQQVSKIVKQEKEMSDTKQGIQAISTTMAKNGAPAAAIQAVLQAETVEDAIAAAGGHLRDPMLDIEMALKSQQLANAKVDGEIKQQSLDAARARAGGNMDEDGNVLMTAPNGKTMTESEYSAAQELVTRLNAVKNSDKKNMSALGIAWAHMPLVKSASKDYAKDVDALKGLLTLADTDKLTGVLSESDMALLRESASTLSLDQTGAAFDRELATITQQLVASLGTEFVTDPYGTQTQEEPVTFDVSDDGMIAMPGSFSTASGGQAVSDDITFWGANN